MAMKLTIKIIVRFVNKEERSFFVIRVLELTIWFALIPNWKKLQKEDGLVHTAIAKVNLHFDLLK